MRKQRPIADSYAEVMSGPARDSVDRWERRRWWSRALAAAIAFLLGYLLLQLGAQLAIPGTSALQAAPRPIVDGAALLVGALLLAAGRHLWPVAVGAKLLDWLVDRMVR